MKKYLTIKKTAKLLHVTPLTLRNWDKSGKLRAYRHPINNYRVYRIEQIEAFLTKLDSSRTKNVPKKIDIHH
jgi:excisionase family DNA binding protein